MIQRLLACLLIVALLGARAVAQPPPPAGSPGEAPSVMVLPFDGDAAPALRTKLTALVESSIGHLGTVKAGTTTLAETAAAIGCDPATASCAEDVRATLSVDVLIYGVASSKQGQVELVVKKQEKGKPEVITTQLVATTGEPVLDATALEPITGKRAQVCAADAIPQADGSCLARPRPRPRPQRVLGISILVGAGLLMIGGLTQWNEKSKKQDQIDRAPTNTLSDFQALEALEDEAASKALTGNVLMVAALGATVAGVWLLRRDRRAQRETLKVTPVVTPTSAGVVLTIGAR